MDSEIKIKIPSSVQNMQIKHVKYLHGLSRLVEDQEVKDYDSVEPSDEELCYLLSVFTGITMDVFKVTTKLDNLELFQVINGVFKTYIKNLTIPDHLEYEGQRYTLQTDFTKLPTSWFMDLSVSDWDENPEDLMSFCYIEEGMTYGETDKHGGIVNPRAKRNEVFNKHVPLDLYLDVNGFFLDKWSLLRPSLGVILSDKELKSFSNRMNGRKRLTPLAKSIERHGSK